MAPLLKSLDAMFQNQQPEVLDPFRGIAMNADGPDDSTNGMAPIGPATRGALKEDFTAGGSVPPPGTFTSDIDNLGYDVFTPDGGVVLGKTAVQLQMPEGESPAGMMPKGGPRFVGKNAAAADHAWAAAMAGLPMVQQDPGVGANAYSSDPNERKFVEWAQFQNGSIQPRA